MIEVQIYKQENLPTEYIKIKGKVTNQGIILDKFDYIAEEKQNAKNAKFCFRLIIFLFGAAFVFALFDKLWIHR